MSNLKFSLNDDDDDYENEENSEVPQPMPITQFLESLCERDREDFVRTYSSSIGPSQKPFKSLAKQLTTSIRENVFSLIQSSIDSLANGSSPKYLFHSLDFLEDSIRNLTEAYNSLSTQASNFLETKGEKKQLEVYFEQVTQSSRDSPSTPIFSAPTIQIRTFSVAIPDGKSSEE